MFKIKMITQLCLGISPLFLAACGSGVPGSNSGQIQYTTLNYPQAAYSSTTGLTGIRQVGTTSNVYITGSYYDGYNAGTLYVGPILGGGTYYPYNYPSESDANVAGTNLYSIDNGTNGNVYIVGSYTTVESGANSAFGFLYTGPIPESTSDYQTLVFPSVLIPGQSTTVQNTIPHSVMGGLVVGNYNAPLVAGNAFIYNIATESYSTINLESIANVAALYTSAYGIWNNGANGSGDQTYTIVGGYSTVAESNSFESSIQFSTGFMLDLTVTAQNTYVYSNFESFNGNNITESNLYTHFEGITTDGNGGYNLAGEWGLSTQGSISLSVGFVHVTRTASGGFNPIATWIPVSYPDSSTTTADTVYQNYLLGVYKPLSGLYSTNGYVATIPLSWY